MWPTGYVAVKIATASVAAELPPRSRETKRLTMGLLILCVAKMRAKGHQKLSIFRMVASPPSSGPLLSGMMSWMFL